MATTVSEGLVAMGIKADPHEAGNIPDLSTLPAPVRELFEFAFGEATAHIFLVAVPFAVLALLCVVFIKEVPLRTTVRSDDELAPEATAQLDPTP